mmetsp:Transcript_86507/g.242229  ORF Transcript_86507/g.242229 Transcript_86507/m.242229 type:complete len:229 (+) Transcript_86507:146-832(+)
MPPRSWVGVLLPRARVGFEEPSPVCFAPVPVPATVVRSEVLPSARVCPGRHGHSRRARSGSLVFVWQCALPLRQRTSLFRRTPLLPFRTGLRWTSLGLNHGRRRRRHRTRQAGGRRRRWAIGEGLRERDSPARRHGAAIPAQRRTEPFVTCGPASLQVRGRRRKERHVEGARRWFGFEAIGFQGGAARGRCIPLDKLRGRIRSGGGQRIGRCRRWRSLHQLQGQPLRH